MGQLVRIVVNKIDGVQITPPAAMWMNRKYMSKLVAIPSGSLFFKGSPDSTEVIEYESASTPAEIASESNGWVQSGWVQQGWVNG
jgi:hypothetical protein